MVSLFECFTQCNHNVASVKSQLMQIILSGTGSEDFTEVKAT